MTGIIFQGVNSLKIAKIPIFWGFFCQFQFCIQLYYWLYRYVWTTVSSKRLYCKFPGVWNIENYMKIASYSLAGNYTHEYKFEVFSDFPKILIVFVSF